MNNLTEERMKEIEETQEVVKAMNTDAVTQLLIDIRNDSQEVKTGQTDLKRIMTDLTRGTVELRAEINMLKAMGFNSNAGTGSTIHK
ncbi:MAG: purine nucleoside phosphorylase [Candidatus Paceibacteria bacterium]|jgi:purine nucleoside phosphorylase